MRAEKTAVTVPIDLGWMALDPAERERLLIAEGWQKVGSKWFKSFGAVDAQKNGWALHDPNFYKDGHFKFQTHGKKDTGDQPCIEDYADPKARKEWPGYYVAPDGSREGPPPFKSSSEEREFQQRFKMRHKERGEPLVTQGSKIKQLEERVRHLQERIGEH